LQKVGWIPDYVNDKSATTKIEVILVTDINKPVYLTCMDARMPQMQEAFERPVHPV
jgi:hypothetical protein